MTALVQDRYVSAGAAMRLADVERPEVGPDEVLVRVRAVPAKLYGWDLPEFVQAIGRLGSRVRKPKPRIPGLDFAGEVEAVGPEVTQFEPGAAVFGWSTGAMAEYVSVPQEALAVKPESLSFAEAATLAMAGFTALQALQEGKAAPGKDVLIIGASGGVGSFAVQLAKAKGANVTGVCSTKNLELVGSLGADHTIDYTRSDFARGEQRYDLIVDMAGNRSLSDLRRVLRAGGTLVMVGQSGIPTSRQSWSKALWRWLRAVVWSRFIDQRLVALIQRRSQEELIVVKQHVEAGELTPTVSSTHPFSDAPAAIASLDEGHGRGRAVIEF